MKKVLNIGVLILIQTTMLFPCTVSQAPQAQEQQLQAIATIRVLDADELDRVIGGKSGGGSNIVTHVVEPEIPNVYQRIAGNSRSGSYCAFAVSLMLQYWVKGYSPTYMPARWIQEMDLEDLDRESQWGQFVWAIDVAENGGFLYNDWTLPDETNWNRSVQAAEALFQAKNQWNELVLATKAKNLDPYVGLVSAWAKIHTENNAKNREPTIIVWRYYGGGLHYSLIVGTRRQDGIDYFLINDPEEPEQKHTIMPKDELENYMSMHPGSFGWVGWFLLDSGIFGDIIEYENWR